MQTSTLESYSPRIKSTLIVGDRAINVRELSSDSISVETSEPLAPCAGQIETLVGDECSVINVQLPEGIDPHRADQPIRIIETDAGD
jgi:hypothetical protein